MAKLNWDVVGERYYESGVDRGVLHVNDVGVAWSGLVSVAESTSGGEAKPFYIDGYKYLNVAASEEFEATITAFSSPPEFAVCEGVGSIHAGLFATQQPRKKFDFSYRTKIGNDVDGLDHAYKIHIIYSALAAPSDRAYETIGDSGEAATRSWDITTLPPRIVGYRPTAHFIVDTRYTEDAILDEVESVLYGTETTSARIPPVSELFSIFGDQVLDAGDVTMAYDTTEDGGGP